MSNRINNVFAALLLSLCLGCTKEVEKVVVRVEVRDKTYSWKPMPQFTRNYRILLGSSTGPNGLYFQQPSAFAALEQRGGRLDLTQYWLNWNPTDISIRNPMGPEFFITYIDSLIFIIPNTAPVASQAGGRIRLHKLDNRVLKVQKNIYPYAKSGAINRNNFLLMPYRRVGPHTENCFVLSRIDRAPQSVGDPIYRPQSRTVVIPVVDFNYPYDVALVVAIDDYFIVDCGREGIYKIREDGTFRKLALGVSEIMTCFKWQGNVYAHAFNRGLAVSSDDGETWRATFGTPDNFRFNTMHPIGDSLVGVFHGVPSFIFTLKYDLVNSRYRVRPLKDDGLTDNEINGLEVWRDTVYVATSGGLFRRPLAQFFESRQP